MHCAGVGLRGASQGINRLVDRCYDGGDRIGKVDDIIVAPDKAVSYAIIGAGGFLGVGRHDVAIPVSQIKQQSDGKFILAGATKDALKTMPPFEYAP